MIDRSNRLCDICGKQPAKMIMLRRRSGSQYKALVCMDCVSDCNPVYKINSIDIQALAKQVNGNLTNTKENTFTCSLCGKTMAEIVSDEKPGCCNCYVKFNEIILTAIDTMQCHKRHVGKTPY